MAGKILIIDSHCTRRIALHARIDRVSFDVTVADNRSDGMKRLRELRPDVLVLAHDLPGLRLRQFCKSLRSDPRTQFVTVLVAFPAENHSARVSALVEGASDVIEYDIEPTALRARLFNYLRLKHADSEIRRHVSETRDAGFAEAAAPFRQKASVTLVSPDPARMAGALGAFAGASFDSRVMSAHDIRRETPLGQDGFVLFEHGSATLMRDLIGYLRSQTASRDAPILYVSDRHGPAALPSLDLGAQDETFDYALPDEMRLRLERLIVRKRAEDAMRLSVRALEKEAYEDTLTGLKSRAFADRFLTKLDQRQRDSASGYAILLADIDHFKAFNDIHGHAAGDRILSAIAGQLRARLRHKDFGARYGGEEFLFVLDGAGLKEARCVAERLRAAVAEHPVRLDGDTHLRATVSIGIAVSSRLMPRSARSVLHAADAALYRAKNGGRNRVASANDADFETSSLAS